VRGAVARRLQAACSGNSTARSWSTWTRCYSEPGGIGYPHRQQTAFTRLDLAGEVRLNAECGVDEGSDGHPG